MGRGLRPLFSLNNLSWQWVRDCQRCWHAVLCLNSLMEWGLRPPITSSFASPEKERDRERERAIKYTCPSLSKTKKEDIRKECGIHPLFFPEQKRGREREIETYRVGDITSTFPFPERELEREKEREEIRIEKQLFFLPEGMRELTSTSHPRFKEELRRSPSTSSSQ